MEQGKHPKTMSIGNATYDLFVRTDHTIVQIHGDTPAFTLPLGEKIRVKQVVETCGGGACNTAVGLARLGAEAYFAGILGSDQWGEKLLQNFQSEQVHTECITLVEGELSSFSIILSASSGERVILYEPGTNAHLHDATFDRGTAEHMDWVYLNRISEESCTIQDDIISILTQRGSPHLTWNPGGCQLDKGMYEKYTQLILAHTDLLLLNKEEALHFTKKERIDAAMDALLTTGVKVVCVTNGPEGATARTAENTYYCPTLSHKPIVDTTGAGDAFGTGMTWALLQGADLPTALRTGTINAVSVLGAIGAQAGLLTSKEIEDRLREEPLPVKTISHPPTHG